MTGWEAASQLLLVAISLAELPSCTVSTRYVRDGYRVRVFLFLSRSQARTESRLRTNTDPLPLAWKYLQPANIDGCICIVTVMKRLTDRPRMWALIRAFRRHPRLDKVDSGVVEQAKLSACIKRKMPPCPQSISVFDTAVGRV